VKQTLLSAAGDGREHSGRRLEKPSSSLKSPEPQTEIAPDVIERRYGALVVIGFRDPRTLKRCLCRCDCGKVVERSAEALTAGAISNCGNGRHAPAKPADHHPDSFASGVASIESWGARKRHRGAP
jgi:hypothetical protein